ncbi:MAG TPA: hypothetical protein VGH38_28760 [Bryobacteraceae bacterium]
MKAKNEREEVLLLVRVSVPVELRLTKRGVAREGRTLINEQCTYAVDPGDIRVRSCRGLLE